MTIKRYPGAADCGRCFQPIGEGELERCWYCEGPLCVYCCDRFSVCGCPGSDQAQEDLIHAATPAERRAIMQRGSRRSTARPRNGPGRSRGRTA
jgi:hypothetical protein